MFSSSKASVAESRDASVIAAPPKDAQPARKRQKTGKSTDTAAAATKKTKSRKPKQTKSTRTVTRTVLNKYGEEEDQTSSIAQMLANDKTSLETGDKNSDETKDTAKPGKPAAKRGRPKKTLNAPAPPVQRPKVLPPDLANRKIDRQELFFGTSSQLATGESVDEMRELQQALSASEQAAQASTERTSGGLWAAGSRGDDDFLLPPSPEEIRGATIAFRGSEFVDIDDVEEDSVKDKPVLKVAVDSESRKGTLLCASADMSPLPEVSRATPVVEPKPDSKAAVEPASKAMTEAAKPKRPRGRPRKAEASPMTPKKKKGKAAAIVLPSPNKEEDDTFVNIDDIDDPDQQTKSTPKRGRKKAEVGQLDLSPSRVEAAAEKPKKKRRRKTIQTPPMGDEEVRDWKAETEVLFPLITQAVKEAPPSSELSKPNWHEKMLLYDPIPVEDLADWLNAGPLDEACGVLQDQDADTRWVGTVESWKVKLWCERHSVVCYSRASRP